MRWVRNESGPSDLTPRQNEICGLSIFTELESIIAISESILYILFTLASAETVHFAMRLAL